MVREREQERDQDQDQENDQAQEKDQEKDQEQEGDQDQKQGNFLPRDLGVLPQLQQVAERVWGPTEVALVYREPQALVHPVMFSLAALQTTHSHTDLS